MFLFPIACLTYRMLTRIMSTLIVLGREKKIGVPISSVEST